MNNALPSESSIDIPYFPPTDDAEHSIAINRISSDVNAEINTEPEKTESLAEPAEKFVPSRELFDYLNTLGLSERQLKVLLFSIFDDKESVAVNVIADRISGSRFLTPEQIEKALALIGVKTAETVQYSAPENDQVEQTMQAEPSEKVEIEPEVQAVEETSPEIGGTESLGEKITENITENQVENTAESVAETAAETVVETPIENVAENTSENAALNTQENIPQTSVDTPTEHADRPSELAERVDPKLSAARTAYVEQLVPYLSDLKTKREKFAVLMSALGAERKMPLPPEPSLLTAARDEYKKIRYENLEAGGGLDSEVEEVAVLRNEILADSSEHTRQILLRGLGLWDKISGLDNTDVVTIMLSGDSALLETPPAEVFEGIRPDRETEAVTVKSPIVTDLQIQTQIQPTEAVAPEKMPEQVPEQNSAELVFPLKFEGKELKVIRSTGSVPEVIKVVLDGTEIALGLMTSKGPEVKLAPAYQKSLFFAETAEQKSAQKAFELAASLMKTFK